MPRNTHKGQFTRSARSLNASAKARGLRRSGSAIASLRAEAEEVAALELMKTPELVRGAGEVIACDSEKFGLLDMLENPSAIGADASEARQGLLADAGVLELGLDASQSISAANSIERMLGHQFAAAHALAMKLAARATDEKLPPVEAARLSNASMRCMDTFQSAMLALQRLRTGGQQRITVQHVQVNDGGQAIVAGGNLGAGGHTGGVVPKK